jgi:hypothetical protein
VNLLVVLEPDAESDDEEFERLSRGLRAELAELDVDSVEPAGTRPPPPGAKSADPVTIGAIVVALSASGGVFTSLVETLRDWLTRNTGRHRIALTIDGDTIEMESATAAEQRALVDAYIGRHTSDE